MSEKEYYLHSDTAYGDIFSEKRANDDDIHVIEYSEYEQLKAENVELDSQIARMDKALCSRDRKIKQLQEELDRLRSVILQTGGS